MKARTRRARWFRATVVAGLQLGLAIGCLELGAVLAYPILFDRAYSRDGVSGELVGDPQIGVVSTDGTSESVTSPLVAGNLMHPYLGFVRESVEGEGTNEYGFLGPDPVRKRSPSSVNVALVGGSLALHLYRNARATLRRGLAQWPSLAGRDIHIVCLALPGYKQPQQLLALTYMTFLGAEYDIVINLDGFNEVVLPFSDNLASGTYLHHPRLWNLYAREGLDVAEAIELAEIANLRRHQKRLREIFSSRALRWSNFALLLWKALDREAEAEIRRRDATSRARLTDDAGAPRAEPRPTYDDDWSRYFADVVNAWARASHQIQGLARGGGFSYFHFLQPNQYVPGSKPLSPREWRIARIDAFEGGPSAYHPSVRAYKWAVEAGYPLLRQAGRVLRRRGVEFVDLTMMFETTRRTMYDDACCHLNRAGYRRLARRIAAEVGSRLAAADLHAEETAAAQ